MPADLPSGPQVAPSILSADFSRLGDEVDAVMEAGARVIHVDVMDGHFVPPITMGPLVVESLRDRVRDAGGLLDVHLMIESPERQVDAFARAGADVITIHQEATPHVDHALRAVREAGCRAGLAICPGTPAEVVAPVAELLDLALCMTVNPGWGGQAFIASSLDKVRALRALLPDPVLVEVDGGVGEVTAGSCREAGADWLVAGSAVFGDADAAAAYGRLVAAIS